MCIAVDVKELLKYLPWETKENRERISLRCPALGLIIRPWSLWLLCRNTRHLRQTQKHEHTYTYTHMCIFLLCGTAARYKPTLSQRVPTNSFSFCSLIPRFRRYTWSTAHNHKVEPKCNARCESHLVEWQDIQIKWRRNIVYTYFEPLCIWKHIYAYIRIVCSRYKSNKTRSHLSRYIHRTNNFKHIWNMELKWRLPPEIASLCDL